MDLLSVQDLHKHFPLAKRGTFLHAADSISFTLQEGEFLGLVGESGCGKSTIAKMLIGLIPCDTGEILLDGKPLRYPYPRTVYRNMQMIFQMPKDSFDPKKTMGQALRRVLKNFGAEGDLRQRAAELLEQVGLEEEFLLKYPAQMSGGECQRAAIARALAVSPRILICDEITSSLDVSVQAQIIDLLLNLKENNSTSVLFISHDLALVQQVCSRVLVMKEGKILENADAGQIINAPEHPYTRELVASIFNVEQPPVQAGRL